jgi:hypothetical protein
MDLPQWWMRDQFNGMPHTLPGSCRCWSTSSVPSSPAVAAPKSYLLPQTTRVDGDGGAICGVGARGATGRQATEPAPRPAGRLVLRVLRELVEERLEPAAAGGLLAPFRLRCDPIVGRGVDVAAGGPAASVVGPRGRRFTSEVDGEATGCSNDKIQFLKEKKILVPGSHYFATCPPLRPVYFPKLKFSYF